MAQYLDIGNIGTFLDEEFLEPLGLTHSALAKAIDVPPNRITNIINGKTGISTDTDLRLCRYFNMSDGFFIRVQNRFDTVLKKRELGNILRAIKPHPVPHNFEARP